MQQQAKKFSDRESLSRDAAHAVIAVLAKAVEQRGVCSLVLSGGSSPGRLYELLSESPFRDQIDWARLHVFWSDERCVGPDDTRSNYRCVRSSLLQHVPLLPCNIHRMHGELDPRQAAVKSAVEIKLFFEERFSGFAHFPSFDCVLLGMGADGHIASLFPGNDNLIHEEDLVITTRAPKGMPVAQRLSLSLPLLAAAHQLFFIVCGQEKQSVVDQVLSGASAARHYPASRICERSRAVWFISP